MITLSDKDYRDILDTVYMVNSCENKSSFLDILMPSMINLFHADCVTFHLIQGYPWHIKIIESRSFKSERHHLNEDKVNPELYKANYYQQSPLLKEAISSSKIILKVGESISLKEWEHSDLYNNFIVPQNLYWEMFLTLRWKNNLEGMITIWRSKDQGDYVDNDISKAEVLAPHLTVATHNVSTRSKLDNKHTDFIASEEDSSDGLLLLDHKLKPLYFNDSARQICNRIDSNLQTETSFSTDGEFPIPSCILQDCSSLLELLKVEEHPILWPKERIILTDGNLRYRVECSLIWKADQVNSQPNFVVILNEVQPGCNPGINLQAKFNLSKRELDIIYYLNKGLSYDEIGEKLFISKLTVHTHIKNIYRKLGAKSRIEIYRYIQPPSWVK
jgi:DNA-binding CsgD family transcriptional regulator